MKIYLDIDDTLINTDRYDMRPANHLKPFLDYMIKNHEVYWLTTHCNGDATVPVSYLNRFVPQEITEMLMKIKPTSWNVLKTEAIDMNEDFLWFDDTLSWGEEKALKENNKLNSHVKINLDDNPDILLEFIEKPAICKAYIIDIFRKSYMLHIWTWPKFALGWHKKIDGPNKRLFWVYKY